jgi:hypothetical protein
MAAAGAGAKNAHQDATPMHTRHCLKIADRIHRVLVRELGQGLDRQRMVREALYARDVLLVCDALRDTDAPFLAQHFRRAAAAAEEGTGAGAAKHSGFGVSRFLVSLFGATAEAPGR